MVYGICTNTGGKKDGTPCSKCQEKEKQAIRVSKEFVCEECGEPLTKVDPPAPKPSKWLLLILALVVVGGGIGAYFGFIRGAGTSYDVSLSINKSMITLDAGASETLKTTVTTTPYSPDTNVSVSFTSDNSDVAQVDNAGVVRAVAKGKTTITVIARAPKGAADTAKVKVTVNEISSEPAKKPNLIPTPEQSSKNNNGISDQGWYTWDGGFKDGKPHGKGRMRITRTYTIELVDITGSKITVYPGETIDAMLDHGRIRGGDIIHKDGSSTTFVNNL